MSKVLIICLATGGRTCEVAIDDCTHCPLYEEAIYPNYPDTCGATGYGTDNPVKEISDCLVIPEWCPLPDWKDNGSKDE